MKAAARRSPKLPTAGLHRIAAVARATGISQHALRIWERRYGALASHRSPKGYRLYTDGDIARLGAIKELLELGCAIGDVAALTLPELERLRAARQPILGEPAAGPFAEEMRARFLAALETFDLEAATEVASACARALTPDQLVAGITAPLLAEIGRRWQASRFSIAQEHAASAILRGQLTGILRAARPAPGGRVLVATTPEGELHEHGALIAAVVAAGAGARVIYLGPNTPAPDIAAAASSAGADAVMLSLVCLSAEEARERLLTLRRALAGPIELWAGGAALQGRPPAGVVWIRSLEALRARARTRRPGTPSVSV